MSLFHMSDKWVEQRTDEIFRSPKNRFLRFLRRGGSREDAKFVASTQFLIESKIALGQRDVRTTKFAANIRNAKTVKDIQNAAQQILDEEKKLQ